MSDGWTPSNFISALSDMGLSPEANEPSSEDQLGVISVEDPATRFGFALIYMWTPGGGAREPSFLTLMPAPHMSPEDAAAISARLAASHAFTEDGYLWIYAELDTSRPFTAKLFRAQTELYLQDMRLALQLFVQSTRMTMVAAKAFHQRLRSGLADDVLIQRLRNDDALLGWTRGHFGDQEREIQPRRSEPEIKSLTSEACPRCKGSGKRMFRPCKECFGSGELQPR